MPGTEYANDLRHKLGVLREHCATAGRDYARIEKTVGSHFDLAENLSAGFAGLLGRLRELAGLGIDHAMVSHRGPWTEASLAALAAVLPEVHAIPVAA